MGPSHKHIQLIKRFVLPAAQGALYDKSLLGGASICHNSIADTLMILAKTIVPFLVLARYNNQAQHL